MPRLYFVIPCVLTLLFGGLFWHHHRQTVAETKAAAEAHAKVAATKAAEQTDAEAKARAAAEQRAAERAAAEVQAEANRHAKWLAEQAQLETELAAQKDQATSLQGQIAAAKTTLAKLQAERDRLRQANLADGLAVERLRIARQTAELELQRLITLLARRNGAPDPALDLAR